MAGIGVDENMSQGLGGSLPDGYESSSSDEDVLKRDPPKTKSKDKTEVYEASVNQTKGEVFKLNTKNNSLINSAIVVF
jgi:hypothetical protein